MASEGAAAVAGAAVAAAVDTGRLAAAAAARWGLGAAAAAVGRALDCMVDLLPLGARAPAWPDREACRPRMGLGVHRKAPLAFDAARSPDAAQVTRNTCLAALTGGAGAQAPAITAASRQRSSGPPPPACAKVPEHTLHGFDCARQALPAGSQHPPKHAVGCCAGCVMPCPELEDFDLAIEVCRNRAAAGGRAHVAGSCGGYPGAPPHALAPWATCSGRAAL